VLVAKRKYDIRCPEKLYLRHKRRIYKPNCEKVHSLTDAVNYACKGGSYDTNMADVENGVLLSSLQMMLRDADEHGIQEAMVRYFDREPNKAVGGKSVQSIMSTLQKVQELKRDGKRGSGVTPKSPYKTDEYKQLPEIDLWKEKGIKTALFLLGEAGKGKTTYAMALLEELGLETLIACDIEDLKGLTSKHQAVLFDDIPLQNINDYVFLALIDIQLPKSIRIRYQNVYRPEGLVLVFTFNETTFMNIAEMMKRPEFARRSTIVRVPPDFMNQTMIADNIHIENINVYNFSLNNPL